MALIKCPECGKEISDHAISCPNCGYVLPKSSKTKDEHNKWNTDEMKTKSKKNTKFAIILTLAFIAVGAIVFLVLYIIDVINRPVKPEDLLGKSKDEIVEILDNKLKVTWEESDVSPIWGEEYYYYDINTHNNEKILEYLNLSDEVNRIKFDFSKNDNTLKMIEYESYGTTNSLEEWCKAINAVDENLHVDTLDGNFVYKGYNKLKGDIDLLYGYSSVANDGYAFIAHRDYIENRIRDASSYY